VPHYRYKARNNRGDLIEGVLEGASADAIAAQLISGGVTPIDVMRRSAKEADLSSL